MNRTDSEPEDFDHLPSLWADFQDLEDKCLNPKRREALMKLLEHSAQARKEYLEYFHQVSVFRMEAAKAMEKGQIARYVIPVRKPAWWTEPWLATAAVLMVAALIGVLILKQHFAPERMFALSAEESVWEINGIRQARTDQGTQVKAGDSVQVISGLVKLELASGSTMVMQGASRASFPALHKPVIHSGWLWIDTAQTDDAFEISTPDLLVKDLGTRFGVRIDEGDHSEVHLLEGGVKVFSQESGITLATLSPDGKGRAIAADGTSRELPLANDPFPLLQHLLFGRSSYGNTVIAQHPSGYWNFDGAVDNWFENEVRANCRAKAGPSVSIHPSGANEEKRFTGFTRMNQSLYFPANEHESQDSSVIAFLDGGDGVSRRQGAMTFWIKQKPGSTGDQTLWLAGKVDPVKKMPFNSLAYTYLTESGQLVFSMANGDENLSVKSSQSIEQGRWHHIGVSWSEAEMSIYLNGMRVGHRSDVPTLEDWVSSGKFVRFGKPTDDLYPERINYFHGWFDEYALWNRPLTPEEVNQQFQAALRKGTD